MATVSEMKTYLAALEAAYYSGVLSVRHGDTATQYQNMDAMRRAISDLKKQIADAEGNPSKPTYVRQRGRG